MVRGLHYCPVARGAHMFDLVAGKLQRPLQDRTFRPTAVSIVGHMLVAVTVMVPLFYATNHVPLVPAMLAFVAEPPALPMPAPPPPLASPRPPPRAEALPATQPAPAPRPLAGPSAPAVPLEAPPAIAEEREIPSGPAAQDSASGESGIDGGARGGSAEGLLGGTLAALPPVSVPPKAPRPVRLGGLIKAPELLQQVQPKYPDIAVAAQAQGVVILEATVGADGRVQSVRLLSSASPLLETAAIDAVKQWQYGPLLLDGTPVPFILTVTLNFSLHHR